MAVVFIFTVVLLAGATTDMIKFIAELAELLHLHCTQTAIAHRYGQEMAAIVCGAEPNPTTLVESMKAMGLYHLLVVSGAHLTFLTTVLTMGRRQWVAYVLPLLFIYILICDLNTPALRAYLHLGFALISQQRRWHWTATDTVLVSSLMCILLKQDAGLSLSLYLSWVTSLTLAIVSDGFWRQSLIFIVVQLALSHITVFHPLAIWTNILLAPVVGYVLLPVSIVVMIAPILRGPVDIFWSAIDFVFSRISPDLYVPPLMLAPTFGGWAALVIVHAVYLVKPNFSRRLRLCRDG